jgi:hypothetical protein
VSTNQWIIKFNMLIRVSSIFSINRAIRLTMLLGRIIIIIDSLITVIKIINF